MTPSRARAREIDVFVLEVLKAMSTGRWGPAMAIELAERHGVSQRTVRGWADQAGRHLRLAMTEDLDSLRAQNAAHLAAIAADAHEMDDYGAAVRAREAIAKLLGLNAPEKHQHAHVVASYEALPAGDRLTQVREAIALLRAEEEALMANLLKSPDDPG